MRYRKLDLELQLVLCETSDAGDRPTARRLSTLTPGGHSETLPNRLPALRETKGNIGDQLSRPAIRLAPHYLSFRIIPFRNSATGNIMAPVEQNLSHEEIWDDSALVHSWNDALDEYKVR